MTAANVARVAMELSGEPYGWGGILMNRDFGDDPGDLFAPFGVWLPRNSFEQAEQGALSIWAICRKPKRKHPDSGGGVPFATLLWLRGHIMLYIGSFPE